MLRQEEEQAMLQTENFTSTMSHEMRTPILTIIFFLQQIISMLSTAPIDLTRVPKCVEYCGVMLSQLQFLSSFVDDLLDLGMLKSGTFTLTSEAFDITKVIKMIYDLFSPQASQKNCQLRVDVQGEDITSSESIADP
mmetsp:Transcript_7417/g.8967  ORF Transcript_7417/g.8967 Transcript_7417/m.8967 type:complete len:137 (-) Transcript_7417:1449-1859(-)